MKQRNFNFRSWNIPTNHMFYNIQDGVLAENQKGQIVVGVTFGKISKDAGSIIMQSLNKNDINGKEIFEFDIVRTRHDSFMKVVFSEEHLCWAIVCGDEWFYLADYLDEIEVIGNIFENPEMVEEMNKQMRE